MSANATAKKDDVSAPTLPETARVTTGLRWVQNDGETHSRFSVAKRELESKLKAQFARLHRESYAVQEKAYVHQQLAAIHSEDPKQRATRYAAMCSDVMESGLLSPDIKLDYLTSRPEKRFKVHQQMADAVKKSEIEFLGAMTDLQDLAAHLGQAWTQMSVDVANVRFTADALDYQGRPEDYDDSRVPTRAFAKEIDEYADARKEEEDVAFAQEKEETERLAAAAAPPAAAAAVDSVPPAAATAVDAVPPATAPAVAETAPPAAAPAAESAPAPAPAADVNATVAAVVDGVLAAAAAAAKTEPQTDTTPVQATATV